jgi:predicted nucleic acid-binding protein
LDRGCKLLTTELVWWEVLNALAAPPWRQRAVEMFRECHLDRGIRIPPLQQGDLVLALQLYESRSDKSWSLTDCLSFLVMWNYGLTAALTADRHFAQAGFQVLLLDFPPGDS